MHLFEQDSERRVPSLFLTRAMENLIKDVNDGLLQALQCPSCKYYMVPPISFCENGHNICNKCRLKVKKCVICQEPHLRGTNLALEAVSRQVAYPCIYKSNGCQNSLPVHLILDHQETCHFCSFSCPFVLMGRKTCSWKGPVSGMRDHILEKHKDKVWEGTGACIRKKIGVSPAGLCNEVIMTSGEIFYVQFRGEDKNFYGFVKYIGPKTYAQQYRGWISILSKDGKEMVAACYVTSSCNEDSEEIITNGKCLKLHYDVVKQFLDDEGNMYTKVEIMKIASAESSNDQTAN